MPLARRHLEAAPRGSAVTRALQVPLRALRAYLESLAESFDEDDARGDQTAGALQEVKRLERSVRLLVEYEEEPRVMPLRCTVDEIARSARASLPERDRERVWIAHEARDRQLHVDGPLLIRCLTRLMENALQAGSDRVLLRIRREADGTVFSVVDRAPDSGFDLSRAGQPFRSSRLGQMGLGLTLALRDVELMGGSLHAERTPLGDTCMHLAVPDADAAAAREAWSEPDDAPEPPMISGGAA